MAPASGTATRAAALVALALACAGCAGSAGPVSEGDVLVVDVYSGRENPQMTLSADDAAAVNEAIEACGDFAASAPITNPALGFRAFTIQASAHEVVVRPDGVWLTDDEGASMCQGSEPFDVVFDVAAPHVENLAALVAPS